MTKQNLPLKSFFENQFISETSSPENYLLIALHGRGDTCLGMRRVRRFLELPTLDWLLINAPDPWKNPNGFEGFSWYERPPIHEFSLKRSLNLLEDLLAELQDMGWPRKKIILMGFSQGAILALELVFSSEHPFAAAICISGTIIDPDSMDQRIHSGAFKTPILVSHGTKDDVLDYETTSERIMSLQTILPNVAFHVFEKGHEMQKNEFQLYRAFLTQRVLQ